MRERCSSLNYPTIVLSWAFGPYNVLLFSYFCLPIFLVGAPFVMSLFPHWSASLSGFVTRWKSPNIQARARLSPIDLRSRSLDGSRIMNSLEMEERGRYEEAWKKGRKEALEKRRKKSKELLRMMVPFPQNQNWKGQGRPAAAAPARTCRLKLETRESIESHDSVRCCLQTRNHLVSPVSPVSPNFPSRDHLSASFTPSSRPSPVTLHISSA